MMKGFFVTGTDTGVGKTCASAGLLVALGRVGLRVVGCKPVSAGVNEQGIQEDVQILRDSASIRLPLEKVGLVQLRAACAPHIAAHDEGVTLQREGWGVRLQALADEAGAEVVVVEGAGGFCVPLSVPGHPRWGLDDVAAELALPVVLVVGLRLGCLNHALLTAQAISARGLPLAGWIGNRIDPSMPYATENLASLKSWLPAPCWGVIPWLDSTPPDVAKVAGQLDVPAILHALQGAGG